jgi:hypothetical protein
MICKKIGTKFIIWTEHQNLGNGPINSTMRSKGILTNCSTIGLILKKKKVKTNMCPMVVLTFNEKYCFDFIAMQVINN